MSAHRLRLSALSALALATLVLATDAVAQRAPSSLVVQADLGTVVQSFTTGEGEAVQQVSVPLRASVRHRSGVGASLRGAFVRAQGDALRELSGLADVQLGASYLRRMNGAAVELSLGATVPTGAATLTPDEFATATVIAIDDYAFDVSTLGQGAAVTPGIAAVVAAGPRLALGAGAAYRVRGSYQPFAGDTVAYAPADELVLSGGLDAQIGRASTVALDVSVIRFGDDAFGGRTYRPGNRVAATMRWAWGAGLVRGRLLMRYRHIFDGEVPLAATAAGRAVVDPRPSHAVLAGGLQIVQSGVGVELIAGARYYGIIETPSEPLAILDVLGKQQVLVDLGLSPAVTLSPGVDVRGTFVYTFGVAEAAGAPPLRGFRAGGGLSVRL